MPLPQQEAAIPFRMAYPTSEAAVLLGMDAQMVRALIKSGRLGYINLSKTKFLVPHKAIEDFIETSSNQESLDLSDSPSDENISAELEKIHQDLRQRQIKNLRNPRPAPSQSTSTEPPKKSRKKTGPKKKSGDDRLKEWAEQRMAAQQ